MEKPKKPERPKKPKEKIQPGDKLAFTIAEAMQSSSLGETSISEAIKDKRLKAHKYGTRVLILRADLNAFLENLPVPD
jgi:excisionase family DNA binding protein